MSLPRAPHAGPALIAAGVVLAAFVHVLAGRTLVGGDMMACFEPFAVALADGLARGDVLRTPLLFHGMPMLGNPVVAAGYPPQWLVAIADPAWALSVSSIVHLAWAAAGMTVLLRASGHGSSASAAGGIALGLSGIAVSSMTQATLLRPLAWAPWVLALVLLARGPAARARHAVLLAVATALLLTTAEPFVLLPCGATIALLLARRPFRPQARAVAGLVAGAALSLVVLIPVFLTVRSSLRAAGFVHEGAMQWSLHPAQALSFLVPHPFGEPGRIGFEGFAAITLTPGRISEYFASSYLGALALGLAAGGALAGGRRAWGLAAALGAFVLLALGSHGPAASIEVDSLRYPVKWLVPALVPFAALVARGVEAAAAQGQQRTRVMAALASCCAAAALVAALARPLATWIASLAGGVSAALADHLAASAVERLPAWAAWSAAFALVAVAVLLAAGRRSLPVAPLLALLLAIDLAVPAVRSARTERRDEPLPEAVRVLLSETVRQRVWLDAASAWKLPPASVTTLPELMADRRRALLFYTGAAYGLEIAFPIEVESLCTMRLFQLADAVRKAGPREKLMLLGASGVTHAVTSDESLLALGSDVGGSDSALRVMRNPLALPRVRIVPEVIVHQGEEHVLALLRDSPVSLFATATLVSAPDWTAAHQDSAPPAASPTWTGNARLVRESATEIVVTTSGDGGCVVVSDAWLPGFRVTVDGAAAPLLPADHAFLGVLVPAGVHEVRFSYRPWRG